MHHKETPCTALSATDIIERINVYVKDRLSPSKVGMLMKKLGFEPRKVHGTTKYRVYERTELEIKHTETEEASLFVDNPLEPKQQDLPF